MADLDLTLHIARNDKPRLNRVGRVAGVVYAHWQIATKIDSPSVITPPRTLREWADALTALADEACRQEDALTDEPLPFTTEQAEAESRAEEFLERERDERISYRTFKTGEAWT